MQEREVTNNKPYSRPMMFAIALHAVLLSFLIIDFSKPTATPLAGTSTQPIIQAVAISSQKVESQMQALKAQETLRERREQERKQAQLDKIREEKAQEEQRQQEAQEQEEQRQHAQQQEIEKAKQIAIQKKIELQKRQQQAELKKVAKQKAAQQKKLAEQKKVLEKKLQVAKEKKLAAQKKALEKKQKTQALEKALDDELKNDMAEAKRSAQQAQQLAQIQSEVDRYKGLILAAISQHWILPDNVDKQVSCKFTIRVAPDGSVLDVKLISSSGNAVLDRSAQAAIHKASPLPVPTDAAVFNQFRIFNLTVKPEGLLSRA